MSYDIRLVDKKSGETLHASFVNESREGTYCMYPGQTRECAFNITYNYYEHLCKAFNDKRSVRCLYGKTAKESIPMLEDAISKLGDDVDPDYWKPTEGNTKEALNGLLIIAKASDPDGVWEGD